MNVTTPPRLNKLITQVSKRSDDLALGLGLMILPMSEGIGVTGMPNYLWDKVTAWRIPDKSTLTAIKTFLTTKGQPGYAPFVYAGGAALIAPWVKDLIGEDAPAVVKRILELIPKIGFPLAMYTALSAFLYKPSTAHLSYPTVEEMITGTQDNVPDSVKEVVKVYANAGAY